MIHISFILKKVLDIMGLESGDVKMSVHNKTLKGFESYWNGFMSTYGPEVHEILGTSP